VAGTEDSSSGSDVPGNRHHLLRHKLTLEDPAPTDKTPGQPEGKRAAKTPRDPDTGKLTLGRKLGDLSRSPRRSGSEVQS